MRKLLFTIILVASLFSCSDKSEESKVKHYDTPKGPVSQIDERYFSLDTITNNLKENSCCVQRSFFNEKGYKVRSETLDGNTAINSTNAKFYDNGLFKRIEYLDSSGHTGYYEEFTLDKNGKYETGVAFDGSGKVTSRFKILAQNDIGSWTHLESYTPDMVLERSEEYTFDKDKLIKQVWKNKDGELASERTFEHNDNGDETRIELRSKMLSHTPTVKIQVFRYDAYDKYKNWTQRTEFDANGKIMNVAKRTMTYRE